MYGEAGDSAWHFDHIRNGTDISAMRDTLVFGPAAGKGGDAPGIEALPDVDVGGLDDIPRLGSRVVTTPAIDIALFRTADDRVFALHDRCPHKAGKLSRGIVHGESVTCPPHNWVIGLTDGQAKEPDEGCARTVPVRLEDGRILLAVGGA